MSVSINSRTISSWKIGDCRASVYQLVNLFGQPVRNPAGDKVPFEWVIGFLNIRIYPYKFEPTSTTEFYNFSIGGTSGGQVIALQAFLDHVATSNIWSENGNLCPALGIEVSSLGYE